MTEGLLLSVLVLEQSSTSLQSQDLSYDQFIVIISGVHH